MVLSTFVFFALLVSANGQSDEAICAKPDDISPCTCDREGISCLNAKSEEDIRRAFRAPINQKSTRTFWLNGSPVEVIRNDTFNDYKVVKFHMEYNKLNQIETGAFDGSLRTMKSLSLDSNKIGTFNFSDLAHFPHLSFLSLRQNLLREVPTNAFNGYQSLDLISLAFNTIRKVGRNAFSGLDLDYLDLSLNDIEELGEESLASVNATKLNLVYNRIKRIDQSAFKHSHFKHIDLRGNLLTYLDRYVFLPLIRASIKNNALNIEISTKGNEFTCKGCKDYKWLVDNKYTLSRVFHDFTCKDNARLRDLTYSSIGCY